VFSRKENLQAVVLDINAIADSMNKMLRQLIGETIELTVIPGSNLGRIKADPGCVAQVLMNLVVNARDAMPNGGNLTVETRHATLEDDYALTCADASLDGYVVLSVTDTGVGMPENVCAHIFEPFFTTKPKGKGTGLGLATCQTIVRQCSGHISVHSELGKGTTFKVYFPRVDEPIEATARPENERLMPTGTETLLFVEDEPAVRDLACSVLESQDYTVLRAANGQDGLRVAREHRGSPIRLVITDVVMPHMGGTVMAEWLKSAYPDLKILFTSGYTDEDLAHHGVLDPGVAFLPKPYTPAVLAHKVREILDNPN
jgi:CheY-like chemotaxis protein